MRFSILLESGENQACGARKGDTSRVLHAVCADQLSSIHQADPLPEESLLLYKWLAKGRGKTQSNACNKQQFVPRIRKFISKANTQNISK